MKLKLDGKEVKVEEGKNLGELLTKTHEKLLDPRALITRVIINGEEIVQEEQDKYLKIPLKEIKTLEIESKSPEKIVKDALTELEIYLEKLIPGVERCYEDFRTGEIEKANEIFGYVIDGLRWFIKIMEGPRAILKKDYEKFVFEDQNLKEREERFSDIVDDLASAQEDADWIMIADLLEYELLPLLKEYKRLLPQLMKEL